MPKVKVKPLSINSAWQGRRFKTPAYSAWREEVKYLVYRNKKFIEQDKLELKIKLYLKNVATSDADNFIKPIQDALVDGGVIVDDRYIYKVSCEKIKSKENYFEYELSEIK